MTTILEKMPSDLLTSILYISGPNGALRVSRTNRALYQKVTRNQFLWQCLLTNFPHSFPSTATLIQHVNWYERFRRETRIKIFYRTPLGKSLVGIKTGFSRGYLKGDTYARNHGVTFVQTSFFTLHSIQIFSTYFYCLYRGSQNKDFHNSSDLINVWLFASVIITAILGNLFSNVFNHIANHRFTRTVVAGASGVAHAIFEGTKRLFNG
jgi:hypothetical protein